MTSHPAATLSAKEFSAVFPFHIAFQSGLEITQAGPILLRVCPELSAGQNLLDFFRVERPGGFETFEHFRGAENLLYVLAHKTRPLRLRGQMVHLSSCDWMVFLLSLIHI